MSARLKLVSGAIKPAKKAKRTLSPRQQRAVANLSLIARSWRGLSDEQRAGFDSFATQWSPNGKKRNTGRVVFQSLNGVRLAAGFSDLLVDSPQFAEPVGNIPDLAITAKSPALSLTGSTPPAFSLTIDASQQLNNNVQVYASRPLSPGAMKGAAQNSVLIAVLNPLPPTIDMASFYKAVFPVPVPGTKIVLEFIPHTDNGFRGKPVTQIVTVTAAP